MYYMRWILKIILFPIILLLSILISFLKFIISVSGMILGILSFLVVLGSFTALIQKDATKFESKNRYVFIYFGLVKKVVRQLDF